MADTPAQAALIDGSAIASNIRAEIGAQVAAMKEKHGKASADAHTRTHAAHTSCSADAACHAPARRCLVWRW
jgi:hypothetical protein